MGKRPTIQEIILSTLAACGTYAASADMLRIECQMILAERIDQKTFRSALTSLKRAGRIDARMGRMDRTKRYFLSESNAVAA